MIPIVLALAGVMDAAPFQRPLPIHLRAASRWRNVGGLVWGAHRRGEDFPVDRACAGDHERGLAKSRGTRCGLGGIDRRGRGGSVRGRDRGLRRRQRCDANALWMVRRLSSSSRRGIRSTSTSTPRARFRLPASIARSSSAPRRSSRPKRSGTGPTTASALPMPPPGASTARCREQRSRWRVRSITVAPPCRCARNHRTTHRWPPV